MNPGFVTCLFASVLVGAVVGAVAVAAGWGWLVAFALYSAAGTITLVATALLTHPGAPRQRRPLALLPPPARIEAPVVYST